MLIEKDDGSLSTLCHSCGFCCQERVLKTFPSPDFLCSEDGVVSLWYLLINLRVYGSLFHLATAQSFRS